MPLRSALLAVTLFLASHLSAEELSVAAASDLNFALRDIAAAYQHTTGNNLKISFGSSGNFFAQIRNGAPFDIFFSADIDFPRQLEAAALVEPGTIYQYATGDIVLWVPNQSRLDISRGLQVLLDPAVKKIAIANPKHAPYGRAAEVALRNAGIYDRIKSKLVLGENISQTSQFVETGNADVGILALSLASAPTMKSQGRYFAVPANLYPPLQQAVVILKRSSDRKLATEFLDFLKSSRAKEIFRRYGFAPPQT